ncbi:MAG: hypothetical protein A2X36_08020 [Elusimicrobia bacterium GWA2_69_24]|nr:MAG: hypothetical protein A2X36_08020 [Elusimicrobia bacterium GWA2_69_24]
MWTREGVFAYPPQRLWAPLAAETAGQAWAAAARPGFPGDPLGLYVHVPAEAPGLDWLGCLQREAGALRLPEGLAPRTLYVGGAGAGTLAKLETPAIAGLWTWLKRRFRLDRLRQTTAEVDAAELDGEKSAELRAQGVGRITARLPAGAGREAEHRRARFAEGIELCRRGGVKTLCIDLACGLESQPPGQAERELEFALALRPDCVFLCEYGPPAGAAAAAERGRLRDRARCLEKHGRPAGAENLQLSDQWARNASFLGLGWGAVSHIRGRWVYGKAGSCADYARTLGSGRPPRLAAGRLTPAGERRAHIIRALEDTGRIDGSTFLGLFGVSPARAFPRELAGLSRVGLLTGSSMDFRVTSGGAEDRRLCARRFYAPEVLRRLPPEG